MSRILVASHERSGTHFLINSIAGCFNLSSQCINVPQTADISAVNKFLQNNADNSHNRIYKSHHDTRFFQDWVFDEYKVIYIYRNPLDTLCSCYHYYQRYDDSPSTDFPFNNDIEKFLFKTKPYLYKSDVGYSYEKYDNNIDRWLGHVSQWMLRDADFFTVSYANLYQDFERTIHRIGDYLKRQPNKIVRPPVSGVSPRRGVIGDHVNLMTRDQINKIKDYINVKKELVWPDK